MSTLVSAILTPARLQMNDSLGLRWTDAALIQYLNDIILEIVTRDHTAYVLRAPFQLVPGTVFQSGVLPSDGSLVSLLNITRNLIPNANAPGSYLPGQAIVKIGNIADQDKAQRGWYSATPGTVIENWIPAGEDFKNFFVYPRPSQQVPVWVEALYTQVPPQMAATTDTIPILDRFRFQMQLGVVGRALMQDIEAGNQPRGMKFMEMFYGSLKT